MPAPTPVPAPGRQVNYCVPPPAGSDAWVVQTATISAVAPDVATSDLVTLSVFTNDPAAPLAVVTDAPWGGGQFVPGAWNWPQITS